MSEPLPPDIAAALDGAGDRLGRCGRPVYFFSDLGSTNDMAGTLAEHGAPEGATVIASAQSSGRGRMGRAWFSPPGAGLYLSVICRDPRAAPFLTLAGGVAVAEGITAATGLPVQIKWPNDVVVEGAGRGRWRKLAGILAEASSTSDGLQHVILGVGINLRPAAYPRDIADRATSIETELGRAPDRAAVLVETLIALGGWVGDLSRGASQPLVERWRALAPSARGAWVEWDTPHGPAAGTTAGIADDGALLVRTGEGTERIISGELRWT
jgi:BirA family transcriptional regulator, biotin operon repressor / biotin---[acetyl-CoA-carboxylase] ligase